MSKYLNLVQLLIYLFFSILHCVFFFHAFLSFVSLSFLAFFWIGFYFPHSFFSNTLKVIFNFHYVIKCSTLFNVLIFNIVFYNSTMMIMSVHFFKSQLEFFWLLDSGLGGPLSSIESSSVLYFQILPLPSSLFSLQNYD